MQSPRTQKEVQRLTGRIAALTWFISRAGGSDEPDNLQGCQEAAPGGERLLGPGAPNNTMVLPNDSQSHHRGDPFSLVYGSDGLLPVEINLETTRVSYYDELANEQGLRLNLDLLEEKKAAAVDKMARYKDKPGKMESPWEGPYLVRTVVVPITYELKNLEGRQVPRSWNTCHLRKYYM
ncbi:hypothetical protein LIER_22575 [Lithospermum erythrorhizon]|uniref:Uncharacterized protein n=1 Tax=Lithospermum erythrorhizon TaxID=34254 RepID=A0AAV3QYL1_LITER